MPSSSPACCFRDDLARCNLGGLLAVALYELAGGALDVGFFHVAGIARGGAIVGVWSIVRTNAP